MIAGPAPLKGLEIWISGQRYKLFHEAMTVTQGATLYQRLSLQPWRASSDLPLSSRRPDTAFGILQKRLISDTESLSRDLSNNSMMWAFASYLVNEKREKYSRPLVKSYENMRMILF